MAKTAKVDTRFRSLTGVLWEAFGAGAGMPMDTTCIAAARKLGYYDNVRKRRKKFSNPGVLDEAIWCSERAGKRAAKRAKGAGRKCITAADFTKAVDGTAKALAKMGKFGEICG